MHGSAKHEKPMFVSKLFALAQLGGYRQTLARNNKAAPCRKSFSQRGTPPQLTTSPK